jgi:Zn-dependent protease
MESTASNCTDCGTQMGPAMLACPVCQKLVFGSELAELARLAEAASVNDQRDEAIGLWQRALTLLPPQAKQREKIEARIQALQSFAPNKSATNVPAWAKWLGVAAPGVVFLLTKWKLLLLGFTKLPTLLSMGLFFWTYAQSMGWPFALGLVLSIYVHEMGHVAMLGHYGIPASAPFFIPGLGAVIFAKTRISSALQDAWVGLAGPVAGWFAAAICGFGFLVTGGKVWGALMAFGAAINLFNLLPFLFLDGSRGYRALSSLQRWLVAAAALLAYFLFDSQLSLGISIFCAGRSLLWSKKDEQSAGDWRVFSLFAALLLVLAWMTSLVPMEWQQKPAKKANAETVR